MPNEFEFSFPAEEIKSLLENGAERLIVSAKVVREKESGNSTFEIAATTSSTDRGSTPVVGCPMPC